MSGAPDFELLIMYITLFLSWKFSRDDLKYEDYSSQKVLLEYKYHCLYGQNPQMRF